MKHPIYNIVSDIYSKVFFNNRFTENTSIEVLEKKVAEACEHLVKHIPYGVDDIIEGFVRLLSCTYAIQISGHILIKLNSISDWDDKISKNTLKAMTVSDIKLPYPAFAIPIDNSFFIDPHTELLQEHLAYGGDMPNWECIFVSQGSDRLTVTMTGYSTVDGVHTLALIHTTKLNTELLQGSDEDDAMLNDILFKIASISLYMTTFKVK